VTLGCGIDLPEPVVLGLPPGGRAQRVGSVHAEVHGAGRPVVLVPGLGCGADVYGTLVRALLGTGEVEVHAVTLAGFAGIPGAPPPVLPRWCDDLARYVDEHAAARPILVGHSLGAYCVLAVAIARGDAIAGVVALDGVPAIAGLVDPSIDLKAVAADHVRRNAGMDDAAHHAWWSSSLRGMITDPGIASRITDVAARSEPTVVAHAMAEILVADVRADMRRIRAPVLAVGALGPYKSAVLRGRHLAAFGSMFLDVADRETLVLESARHFVMLDAPSRVNAAIVDFHRRRP
jgi:pimeloyl-ACP methyl ester carboxylesterase